MYRFMCINYLNALYGLWAWFQEVRVAPLNVRAGRTARFLASVAPPRPRLKGAARRLR